MATIKDTIVEFIPDKKVHIVILGTMASRIARITENQIPKSPFYYHNPHNHFWKVIALAVSRQEPIPKSHEEKKAFLTKYGIAMATALLDRR
ncbi:MAG: hypothetical protein HYV97_17925 [Bdellovibrio sp.]|nr:hypothetical protein [Bdellovibrio sp.]